MNKHQIIVELIYGFLGIAGIIVLAYLFINIEKAFADSQQVVWDALAQTPPAPALEVTDEFLMEFVEGEIDSALREKYGVGIDERDLSHGKRRF